MINEYGKGQIRPRRIVKIFLWVSIVLLLLLLILRIAADHYRSVLFPIKTVQLSGNISITEKEILKRIHLDTTSSILLFNKAEAKQALFEDARVQSVEFIKVYPDTLRIQIKEKEKAGVIATEGRTYWVSSDGVILEQADGEDVQEYPLITLREKYDDIKTGEPVKDYMLTSILEAAAGGEKGGYDLKKLIDSFWIEPSGIYILTRGSRYRVYVGDDFTQKKLSKLRALIAVLETLYQHQDGAGMVFDIDMSFSHAAVRAEELEDAL